MRLAIVVPTRNRPAELAGLLANLIGQTRRPDRIVVVDSSDGGLAGEIRAIVAASPLACGYLHHAPPSAAAQRNAGLDVVLSDSDLVALIDDDVTLDPGALEIVCRQAATLDPAIIGFGINPQDADAGRGHGRIRSSRLAETLGLYSSRNAAVAPSGWHTRTLRVGATSEAGWLTSCAVVWRAEAIRDLRFDEYFEAYSYLEDLDFSLQARHRGRFVILSDAAYLHAPAKAGRKSRFWFGRIEIRNRHYIVRKHGLSHGRFWLGAAIRAGMTGAEAAAGRRQEFGRLMGNAAEIAAIIGRLGAPRPQRGGGR